MIELPEPWDRFAKHANKIFYCLKINSLLLNSTTLLQLLSKTNYKTML